MLDLTKDVKYVKGVGPNRVKLLNKIGIILPVLFLVLTSSKTGELISNFPILIFAFPKK